MSDQSNDPLKELEAMGKVADALKPLETHARLRVLNWAAAAYGSTLAIVQAAPAHSRAVVSGTPPTSLGDSEGPAKPFESIADLYSTTQPSGDSDKALVAGYWFQVMEGQADFDSQSINTGLKHLGHGISNITQALGGLMKRKPQLVIQTRKSGTSMQARKRYKITYAGQQVVERMIRNAGSLEKSDSE